MGHLDQAQSDSLKDSRACGCNAHSLGAKGLGSQDPELRDSAPTTRQALGRPRACAPRRSGDASGESSLVVVVVVVVVELRQQRCFPALFLGVSGLFSVSGDFIIYYVFV